MPSWAQIRMWEWDRERMNSDRAAASKQNSTTAPKAAQLTSQASSGRNECYMCHQTAHPSYFIDYNSMIPQTKRHFDGTKACMKCRLKTNISKCAKKLNDTGFSGDLTAKLRFYGYQSIDDWYAYLMLYRVEHQLDSKAELKTHVDQIVPKVVKRVNKASAKMKSSLGVSDEEISDSDGAASSQQDLRRRRATSEEIDLGPASKYRKVVLASAPSHHERQSAPKALPESGPEEVQELSGIIKQPTNEHAQPSTQDEDPIAREPTVVAAAEMRDLATKALEPPQTVAVAMTKQATKPPTPFSASSHDLLCLQEEDACRTHNDTYPATLSYGPLTNQPYIPVSPTPGYQDYEETSSAFPEDKDAWIVPPAPVHVAPRVSEETVIVGLNATAPEPVLSSIDKSVMEDMNSLARTSTTSPADGKKTPITHVTTLTPSFFVGTNRDALSSSPPPPAASTSTTALQNLQSTITAARAILPTSDFDRWDRAITASLEKCARNLRQRVDDQKSVDEKQARLLREI